MSDDINKQPEGNQPKDGEKKPTVLLGSIAYSNYPDYLKFLDGMQPEQAILVLIAAAKFGFQHNLYSMDESELVNRSIRTIVTAANAQVEPPKTNDTPN